MPKLLIALTLLLSSASAFKVPNPKPIAAAALAATPSLPAFAVHQLPPGVDPGGAHTHNVAPSTMQICPALPSSITT